MDQQIYAKVEKILANVSIASIRSWFKGNGKKFSAGSREQMMTRVTSHIEKQDLTFGDLEKAAIGIEEAGGKYIFLFELEDFDASKVKEQLAKAGVKTGVRKIATPQPTQPKLVYGILNGNELRVKWSETHRSPSMNLVTNKIEYDNVTKIIVLVANLETKKAQIRYDRPELVHPHAKVGSSNVKEAYFNHFIGEAESLLCCTLTKSVLQNALTKLVASKELIRLHRDGHVNQRNNRYKVASKGGDIREDEDWIAMHGQSGSSWAYDEESFYWRVEGSKDSVSSKEVLTREVYSHLNALESSVRVDADCWDAEVDYAIGKIRELQ